MDRSAVTQRVSSAWCLSRADERSTRGVEEASERSGEGGGQRAHRAIDAGRMQLREVVVHRAGCGVAASSLRPCCAP